MTIYASEPGTKLGGRYRLEDRITAGSGWAAWKAIDEILARAVTVFTFAAGFPRTGEVVTAARAASRLTDPRLAQVFDVEDAWDRAYIVMEWAAGETLSDLLTQGPLEPFRAARMIADAAAGLASAHAAGVAHMCLSPGSVRWSQTGEVKVVGLGIDAVLSGVSADEPVIADTIGLGRLLYAALTGHWPGPDYPPLPPAPVTGGQPRSPRQIVASIPPVLSDLTVRAMQLRSGGDVQSLSTPAELSRALLGAVPPAPMPGVPQVPWGGQQATQQADRGYGQQWHDDDGRGDRRYHRAGERDDWHDGNGYAGQDWAPDGRDETGEQDRPGRRSADRPDRGGRSPGRRRAPAEFPLRVSKTVVLAGIGVLAVVAVAAFTLWPSGGGPPAGGHPTGKPTTHGTTVGVLTPVDATGFDPLTSPQEDPGNEESNLAKFAIDPSPQTAWTSQWYRSPEFGLLKTGSGLLINMGKAVKYDEVTVTFSAEPGASVELLTGNSDARSKANLESMTKIASASSPTDTYTFRIHSSATGQYLVIWFTALPPEAKASGKYQAEIFNVTVRGTT